MKKVTSCFFIVECSMGYRVIDRENRRWGDFVFEDSAKDRCVQLQRKLTVFPKEHHDAEKLKQQSYGRLEMEMKFCVTEK